MGPKSMSAPVPRLEPPSTTPAAAVNYEQHKTLILPWEAVKSKWTRQDYFRDSRWFLEFAWVRRPEEDSPKKRAGLSSGADANRDHGRDV